MVPRQDCRRPPEPRLAGRIIPVRMDLRSRIALLLQLLIALVAWLAVAWLVSRTYPDEPRALLAFYAALFVALSASAGALFWLVLMLLGRGRGVRPAVAYLS